MTNKRLVGCYTVFSHSICVLTFVVPYNISNLGILFFRPFLFFFRALALDLGSPEDVIHKYYLVWPYIYVQGTVLEGRAHPSPSTAFYLPNRSQVPILHLGGVRKVV